MKKSRKIFATVLPILMLVAVMFVSFAPSVMAAGSNAIVDKVNGMANASGVSSIDKSVGKVWSTVLTILQIAAVAAIVIAGVRYMFASAEQKADIKKGMVILILGAVLVFGASTVVQFIVTATNDIM